MTKSFLVAIVDLKKRKIDGFWLQTPRWLYEDLGNTLRNWVCVFGCKKTLQSEKRSQCGHFYCNCSSLVPQCDMLQHNVCRCQHPVYTRVVVHSMTPVFGESDKQKKSCVQYLDHCKLYLLLCVDIEADLDYFCTRCYKVGLFKAC